MTNIARFREFVQAFTRLVDRTGGDEARIFADGKPLFADLIAHDDWLPDDFAPPCRQRSEENMLRWLLIVPLVAAAAPQAAAQSDAGLADARAYLRISEQLGTAGQITYEEIEAVKDAGFDVVINLAPADEERNRLEGYLVTQQGMTYIQIPVSWQEPSQRDLQLFFDVMKANEDRSVFVHCFANMRVSAFVYLYRTLEVGEPEDPARADLAKIWDPATQPQWVAFIDEAKRAAAAQ